MFLSKFKKFLKDERGVTAIEYGLIAIAMAALLSYSFARGEDGMLVAELEDAFDAVANMLAAFATDINTGQ